MNISSKQIQNRLFSELIEIMVFHVHLRVWTWKKSLANNIFLISLHDRKVRMNIHTNNQVTRIYNVIGRIRGAQEPGTAAQAHANTTFSERDVVLF